MYAKESVKLLRMVGNQISSPNLFTKQTSLQIEPISKQISY